MKLIKNGLVLIVIVIVSSTILGCVDDNSTDSDGDGLTDVSERVAKTNPFDVDTDHDGVWDFKDSNPHYPGILIDSKQKLERSDLYDTDIGIPNGSALKYWKGTGVGYASGRIYENYEINASYSQVLDFFLENMIHDGWQVRCEAEELKHIYYGPSGISMCYSKEWQDQYVTILVVGQDERWDVDPYTQFTIILSQLD